MQGLYEKVNGTKVCKLDDQNFEKVLKQFDILCLQETHCPTAENLNFFESFRSISHCRVKSANNRYFGGLLVFIRNSIDKAVRIPSINDADAIEVILQKRIFSLRQDTKSRDKNILDKLETYLVDYTWVFIHVLRVPSEITSFIPFISTIQYSY